MTHATSRHALPLLAAGQAQKEITHNEALALLDGLSHPAVEQAPLAAPPGSPAAGQMWIIAAAATGEWAGKDGQLALWTEGGWRFLAPRAGMLAYVKSQTLFAWHDGSVWRNGPWPAAQLQVNGQTVTAGRQPAIADPAGGATVDSQARAGLASVLAALRAHGLIAV